MKIREVMSSPAHTCRLQDSLEQAARLLWEHDCGMLPVEDGDGRVCAAITDRDICMGAYTRGRRLADLCVSDSMSTDVVTCGADDDVAVVAKGMAARQVHRLPVVDKQGKAIGVVSLNDLAIVGAEDVLVARDAMGVLVAACRHRAAVPAIVPDSPASCAAGLAVAGA